MTAPQSEHIPWNLHQLRLFCVLAEKGSFSLASREVYITQPALSIQMRRLEEGVGVPLLRRARGGVELTDAGQLLYQTAQTIFQHLDQAERRLGEVKHGRAGAVSVAVSPTGALYRVTQIMGEFNAANPAVKLTLHVDRRDLILEMVAEGRIDVGFEWAPIPDRSLDVRPLTWVDFPLALSPHHPLAGRAQISREDFAGIPYIALDHGLGVPSLAEVTLMNSGVTFAVAMRVPSIDAQKRAIEAGLGTAFMSRFAIEWELETGRLVGTRLEEFELRRQCVLLTRREGQPSDAVRRFVDFALAFQLSTPSFIRE